MSSLLTHLGNVEIAAGVADVVLCDMGLGKMPLELANCSTMEILSLARNAIADVDAEALRGCTVTLRMLDMSHNVLSRVLFLPRMQSLQTLNLSHNEITALPPLRSAAPCLVHIDVGTNRLTEASACDGLPLLETLDMSHNDLDHVTLLSVPSLATLDLSFNRLTTLECQGSRLLREIVLTENFMTALPPCVAASAGLETLRASHNGIEVISPDLSACATLLLLDLNENKIATLPSSLSALRSLTELTMVGNRLTEVPAVVWAWPRLATLDLSHNQIMTTTTSGSPRGAACHASLADLNLSYNALTAFPEALRECSELRCLDAAHNKIEKVPAFLLQCRGMERLVLSHNALTAIPTDVVAAMVCLVELDVDSNELVALPAVAWPPTLRSVYVSDNRMGPTDVQRFLDATSSVPLTDCVVAPQREAGKRSRRWKALDAAHGTLQTLLGRLGQQQQAPDPMTLPYDSFSSRAVK